MIERRINTLEELTVFFTSLTQDQLLRGQTSHHLGRDNLPSLTTSFTRHGCIPPLMQKWIYYAGQILRVLTDDAASRGIEITQAILQHYGWRSFFIDVTKSPGVAAWFAAHKYRLATTVAMTEDCEEDFVMLRHQVASYDVATGDGHLYVLSKSKAAALNMRPLQN